jgi:hypothetical protein
MRSEKQTKSERAGAWLKFLSSIPNTAKNKRLKNVDAGAGEVSSTSSAGSVGTHYSGDRL